MVNYHEIEDFLFIFATKYFTTLNFDEEIWFAVFPQEWNQSKNKQIIFSSEIYDEQFLNECI